MPPEDTGAPAPSPSPSPSPAPSPSPSPAPPAPSPTPAPPAPAPSPEPSPPAGKWPEDWRELASEGDAKVRDRLGRYASPIAVSKALMEAQNRIGKGELLPALGKDPSPEKLKEWREAHGIPEEPSKYDLGEVKIAGAAKATADEYLKVAHQTNQTPEQVKASLKFISELGIKQREQRVESDLKLNTKYEDELRQEWGDSYRSNINLVHGVLDQTTSPAFREKLLGARLDDGTPIGSSPDMLKWLVSCALMQNPVGTIVPGDSEAAVKGIGDEIAAIELKMRTDRQAYDKDEKLQARYRELLGARETMKDRKKG